MPSDNVYYAEAETLALYADLVYWLSCQCEDLVGGAPSRRKVAVLALKASAAALSRDAMRSAKRSRLTTIKKRLYTDLFTACHKLPSWVARTLSRWCVSTPPPRPENLFAKSEEVIERYAQNAK